MDLKLVMSRSLRSPNNRQLMHVFTFSTLARTVLCEDFNAVVEQQKRGIIQRHHKLANANNYIS